MKQWLRRLGRGLVLVVRWTAHIATAKSKGTALADLRTWASTTLLRRDLGAADLPWLTFPAIRWLQARCQPQWRVFEWGSGASTLFFSRRGCRVVSVEHDHDWYHRVTAKLEGYPQAQVHHVPPTGDAGRPDAFQRYAAAIDRFPSGHFDLVLVDGRARLACLEHALSKVAPTGVLVLDDSQRSDYSSATRLVPTEEWRTLDLPGPRPSCVWPVFTTTTVFQRRP